MPILRFLLRYLSESFQYSLPHSICLRWLQTQSTQCLSDPFHRLVFAADSSVRYKLDQETPGRSSPIVQCLIFSHRLSRYLTVSLTSPVSATSFYVRPCTFASTTTIRPSGVRARIASLQHALSSLC